jgi:hypothetical protein
MSGVQSCKPQENSSVEDLLMGSRAPSDPLAMPPDGFLELF